MTDHHDPLQDLASAHLDGEGDLPDPSDRELRAQIDRLGAARDALRSAAAPADALRREQAIAAALAVFDEEPCDEEPCDEEPCEVGPFSQVLIPPRWHRPRRLRAVELAGIAAAIVLVALAVPVLGHLRDGSREEVVAPTAKSSTDAAPGAGMSGDDSSSTQMVLDATATDLGAFADVGVLADAVRARLAATATTNTTSRAEASTETEAAATEPARGVTAPPCARERAAGGTEVFTAQATLDGRPVIVVVHEDPGGRTLVVLAHDDCSTISSQRL